MPKKKKPTTTLGQRIAAERKALGISQRELAAACGISQPAVHKIERDKAEPKVSTVRKIAEALGCSCGDLLD